MKRAYPLRFSAIRKNSGDTPRRLGNEFLFQELAEHNIGEFENTESKIVTIDPHAYNMFKMNILISDSVEVYHHTELLAELVSQGKLKPLHPVNETITFHDSCYLGRYNEVYEPPRAILKAIPGVQLKEMERSRENGCAAAPGRAHVDGRRNGSENQHYGLSRRFLSVRRSSAPDVLTV